MAWLKGNTHTHTNRSDGDSPIEDVVAWYATHGYDWLAITDHNRGLSREQAKELSEKFNILIISGNEVSGTGHVVGLGIAEDCNRDDFKTPGVLESLQRGVAWIREHGGVPILAHPNWGNKYGGEEISKIPDCSLFEIHNAGPDCNTFAAGGRHGVDDVWNDALNLGVKIYGVASDDSHHFFPEKFHAKHSSASPGEGWTYVECDACVESEIIDALESGRCVASSGAFPVKVGVYDGDYVVEIDDEYKDFTFTTSFIGPDGVLAEEYGRATRYSITGSEKWVRARIFCSSGRYMWTQPVFSAS